MRLVIILVSTISFSIFAESTETNDSKPKIDSHKKWYVYLQASRGNANAHVQEGSIISGKLGFEYRINPYIGLGSGVSANSAALKEKTQNDFLFTILILSKYPSDTTTINPTGFLPLFIRQAQVINLNYSTISGDFNFHLNKDRIFDPYVGLAIIGGSCTGGGKCTVAGGEGKLGLQVNFDTFFFYLQGQYQSLVLTSPSSSSGVSIVNAIGSAGLGVRF